MIPALHETIWQQILSYLRRPTPRPTGKNPRSSIRQDDLCRLMRVSKLLNNVAAPLLYTTLITDDLSAVIYNIDEPAAAEGTRSKAHLLGCVRHLFLEYGSKDDAEYGALLRHGRSLFAGIAPGAKEMAEICGQEADSLYEALKALSAPHVSGEKGYMRIKTIATGAFLDAQVPVLRYLIWDQPTLGDLAERITTAETSLAALIILLSPEHFCQRITCGPLALPAIIYAPTVTEPQSHRAHLGPDSGHGTLPIVFGGKSRWYFDVVEGDPLEEKRRVYELLRQRLTAHGLTRELVSHTRPDLGKMLMDVEAVVSNTMIAEKLEDRLRQNALREIRRRNVPSARFEADTFTLRDAGSCEPCEACGWCADDLRS